MRFFANPLMWVLVFVLSCLPARLSARTNELMNFGWKFHLGEAGTGGAKELPLQRAAEALLTRGKVVSASEGSNDPSYVDLEEGGSVEFTVRLPASGTYDLNFKTTGKVDGMAAKIDVNGTIIAENLPVPNTGSWTSNWKIISLKNVELKAGENTIRFTDNGFNQPMIDQLEVVDTEGGHLLKSTDIPDFAKISFDDAEWQTVDLPHDFQIEQNWAPPSDAELKGKGSLQRLVRRGFKELGVGWYRKEFQADPAWKGKRVILDIEGIMLVGDVWFNGQLVGRNEYGYLGIECDLTKLISFETPNVIAVRADTLGPNASRWYTGGGLYRDVHLVVKDPVSIARHGVFVTTPRVTDAKADVNVQVEIDNPSKDLQVKTTILDPNGKAVAEAEKSSLGSPVLLSAPVVNPMKWSCETPHLYTAKVELLRDGKQIDSTETMFGIRTVEFSPDKGLLLNGKKVLFKGVNLHHDLGAVGAAAYESSLERRMKALKEMGVNGIRTAHNPYSESFMKLADKHGFMLLNEVFDKWDNDHLNYRVGFYDIYPWAVEEWIKRSRNHPSVIFYSVGNEVVFEQVHNEGKAKDWGVTTFNALRDRAKEFDSTRKFTVGHFPARWDGMSKRDEAFFKTKPPQMAFVSDVVSYNYLWKFFAIDRQEHPDWVFFQSEATTAELGRNFFGMDLDKVVGLAYWGAVAYLGESGNWPHKGFDRSVLDLSLEKRPQFYFIQSYYSDHPMVHLAIMESAAKPVVWNNVSLGFDSMTENWNRASGSKVNVVAYSNAEEVELFLNGKSLGTQKNKLDDINNRNKFAWFVDYAPGGLKAVARTQGKVLAEHQLETVGEPVALKLEPENANWKADRLDLQHIRVHAVDDKGRNVFNAKNLVRFDVDGPAKLIALDNGDIKSNEEFVAKERSLDEGHALAILRAGKERGTVVLKATADGLQQATLSLKLQ